MYLLDTNVISELRKADMHPAVQAWDEARPADAMFTSVIVLQEILTGILGLERRDPTQAAILRRWYETDLLPSARTRALPVTLAVSLRAAEFHVPDPVPDDDALIGATAAVHGLTVVTRNTRDFERFGVDVLNPWQAAG